MDELQALFKEVAINIQIFIGTETVDDPNYNTKSVAYLNPKPVRAIVQDISYASATYRAPGIKSGIIKELTIAKRHRGLIEKSRKILIGDSYFYGYRPANGDKIQIKEAGNYIIVLVATDETL